jgi:hypothetical protein
MQTGKCYLYRIVQGMKTFYQGMATLMVYKRNSKFIDLFKLVEDLSLGLMDTLQKYYNKPLEKQATSIVT